MNILTIAVDDKGQIKTSGDIPLPQGKNLIDALLIQLAMEQGRQEERAKIRKGFKKVRNRK